MIISKIRQSPRQGQQQRRVPVHPVGPRAGAAARALPGARRHRGHVQGLALHGAQLAQGCRYCNGGELTFKLFMS